jgi:hypothetical protein
MLAMASCCWRVWSSGQRSGNGDLRQRDVAACRFCLVRRGQVGDDSGVPEGHANSGGDAVADDGDYLEFRLGPR